MVTTTAQRVVGVRFRRAGKVYFFDPRDLDLQVNAQVVVETEKGLEVGWVVIAPRQVIHSEIKEPLRPILRTATAEDLARKEELGGKAREALVLAKHQAEHMGLPLKIVETHFPLDGRRLVVDYTTEEQGDFRALIRFLGERYRMPVELHQMGPRDEAKALGALGRCGRPICCTAWLTKFDPVTIRMAKEQQLPISATNLAGQCGRLRCCLRFEYEQYIAFNKALPRIGEIVTTPLGTGKVIVGHPLRQTVSVLVQDTEAVNEFPLASIERQRP